MPYHTVVAVYETAAQAAAAVNDLQVAHILPDAISQPQVRQRGVSRDRVAPRRRTVRTRPSKLSALRFESGSRLASPWVRRRWGCDQGSAQSSL